MMSPKEPAIHWPAEFEPERCPVHVRNELSMSVPPERVWPWLIRAVLWPYWYPNSKRVRILRGPSSDLAFDTVFHWWTFWTPITSQVREFEPYERIAWNAKGPGVLAYHAWLITPTRTGCHVLTEESQHGRLARLHSFVIPSDMSTKHQIWLERLQEKAAWPPPQCRS